ncbi:sugar phosphate isomerase/epimerase family protein [Novosphingobium sp. JCM 18896]|uniref:sugar phosphate isomerase/epimerase family protein n=1 Tax=Novosphingobium sp. JCM 18896 TaxID=2989731 RepID=UPI00222267A6|nr:sugar phosphate isomerase/epimerase [Novosphingobium sp. JCM 18896]MCW1430356.1 sugar phosphate isomerase/epimerase [Novosphingobium sp. JCM 18896]
MTVNRLGMEMLTVLSMPPADYVRLAGKLGCATVSMGLSGLPLDRYGITEALYPAWSLRDDPALRRETLAALRDTGVKVGLAEGFSASAAEDVSRFVQDLDLFAELRAERLNAICLEDDMAMAVDQLGKLADLARERDMVFTIEFFPCEGINSFERTLQVIDGIGRDRAKVLLDTMHFFRTGGTLEKLHAAGTDAVGYVQLADAPNTPPDEHYFRDAMFARLVPGEGELALRELIAALPADLPISVEVPRLADLRAEGPRAYAERVIAAARGLGA